MNNLYIIEEVLEDYTPGMVVICAPSLDRCREIFVKHFAGSELVLTGKRYIKEFDHAIKAKYYKVIEDVNHPEGVVSYVYGGG